MNASSVFFKLEPVHLVKATQSFEGINIDFRGPLPPVTNNKYILTVVDKLSRFPFIFPYSKY